ncbi:hypothetical protein EYW49_09005 [Siculibacillus lacustris]|uniref:ATPase dynein-related AAA domain-containing protein n=1 Tax=Siculibacillus lacustris TaxID=1549641 RepID=A0A4Q9VR98_9HYPH|nr:AAA family ATPase [Siculibacillus lacustris]TBW38399.1 hypothetical protein EYW49_09005 [Siculibacillus lacustris]
MIAMFSANPSLMIFTVLVAMALALTTVFLAYRWEVQRARLPEATRYDGLTERNRELATQIEQKEDELRILDQKITDRDRLVGELAALEERLHAVKAEYESLSDARQQIDDVKRQAAEAAGEFAEASANRDAIRAECDDLKDRRTQLTHEIADLEARVEQLRKEAEKVHGVDKEVLDALRREIETTQATKAALDTEVAELRAARGALVAERGMAEETLAEAGRLQSTLDDLRKQVEAQRRAVEEIAARRAALSAEAERIERLVARKAALDAEVESLERRRVEAETAPDKAPADLTAMLEELKRRPSFLDVPSGSPALVHKEPQTEESALYDVSRALEEQKLAYDDRTLRAFHTALKINDNAQMTVLAGVSGTGKSLLPRRYSEAMGLHFLQLAVEPRWDSPQDLLGFYNYIEKRYRATELARALVHMDPRNTSTLCDTPQKDRVLVVLLDEMNLARVEYYFSEFLSRLEVRPRRGDTKGAHKDAELVLDIGSVGAKPIRLYPSHNVLFVGTMNDDESTQSLSDKVLDRSNVMQFSAPEAFAKPADDAKAVRMTGYRDLHSWQSWIRPISHLDREGLRPKVDDVINKLAVIMQGCGRPFGHRLNEATLAYVANYPLRVAGQVEEPLVDQIEFRILPKLRGLQIDNHHEVFDELQSLIRTQLNDPAFAAKIGEYVARQEGQSNQFSWRGISRKG